MVNVSDTANKKQNEKSNEELSYVLVKELGLPIFVEILKLVEKGVFINATLRDKNDYIKKLTPVLHTLKSLLNFYHLKEAEKICLLLEKELQEKISSVAVTSEKRKDMEEHFLQLKKEIYQFMENALGSSTV